eukprot:3780014-Pyramimonas_sp.AAC.1
MQKGAFMMQSEQHRLQLESVRPLLDRLGRHADACVSRRPAPAATGPDDVVPSVHAAHGPPSARGAALEVPGFAAAAALLAQGRTGPPQCAAVVGDGTTSGHA